LCIIVVKPQDKKLDKKVLKQCWTRNKDGGGFMYAGQHGIVIRKELHDFKKLWNDYQKRIINTKQELRKNVVFHFRIRTHGEVDEENCHPFYINNGQMAFCHNGTISNMKTNKDSKLSDTVRFRNHILNHLPKNWIKNQALLTLVYEFINYNKFAFMEKNGDVHILNEEKGTWDNGIWYSNTMYKPVVVTTPTDHSYSRSGYSINDKRYNSHYGDCGDWEGWDDAYQQAETPKLPGAGKFTEYISTESGKTAIVIKDTDTIKEMLIKIKEDHVFEDSQTFKDIEKDNPHNCCKVCANTILRIDEIQSGTCTFCQEMVIANGAIQNGETASSSQLH
jgi:glutamine amidotransferase